MSFQYDDTYFLKIAKWIINAKPGDIYYVNKLCTLENIEKFKWHIGWYNQCRPSGWNKAEFLDGVNQIQIVNVNMTENSEPVNPFPPNKKL